VMRFSTPEGQESVLEARPAPGRRVELEIARRGHGMLVRLTNEQAARLIAEVQAAIDASSRALDVATMLAGRGQEQ
jgi:hypothetical protein